MPSSPLPPQAISRHRRSWAGHVLGSKRRDREVAQDGAAVAVDRDEMLAVGEHPDQVHPLGVWRPGSGREREVAKIADQDRAPAAPHDHPAIVAAEPQRRGPHGLSRPDVEQGAVDQRPGPHGRILARRDQHPIVGRHGEARDRVGMSRLEDHLGTGRWIDPGELAPPEVQAGGTRPMAWNPWSPSLESCWSCFRQVGRFCLVSGLPSPFSRAEVNGPDGSWTLPAARAVGREPGGDTGPAGQPAEPLLARRDGSGRTGPWPAGQERASRPTAVASQQTT